jgi:hypothetical protein
MANQKYTPTPGSRPPKRRQEDDIPPGLAKVCSRLDGLDLRLPEGSRVAQVILKYVPDTQRGVRVITGARKGHEGKYGTKEEKRTRWNAYQVEVDRRHELNPSLSYEALCKEAAEHFNVNKETIKRHTVNKLRKK